MPVRALSLFFRFSASLPSSSLCIVMWKVNLELDLKISKPILSFTYTHKHFLHSLSLCAVLLHLYFFFFVKKERVRTFLKSGPWFEKKIEISA